jgi:hypothetical protein
MDTIILKIYGPNRFQIRNKTLFLPELTHRKFEDLSLTEIQGRNSSRPYLRKFVLHPKPQAEYLPQVEVFETLAKESDKVIYILKITFSAPKLLYWNSMQEVTDKDKQSVVYALNSSLSRVGIVIENDVIESARIEAVHLCKNVPLPKTIAMREILAELAKVDISKVVDVTDRLWKNGGRVLQIYSGTIEYAFYDKVSDSMRPKNKRSDKNHIDNERTVVDAYKLHDQEVFRYEYRIKKTQTVQSKINKLLGRDAKTPVIFSDLFTPNLHKNIILQTWHGLIQRPENQLALFETTNKLGLLLHIFRKAKKQSGNGHSMNNAFISYGIATAIKDHGVKEIRGVVTEGWNKDHPERFTKKIKVASELIDGLPYSNNITYIDKALEKFEIINLASLQKGI